MSRIKWLAGEPEGESTGRLRKEGPAWLPMSWSQLGIDGYGALIGETDSIWKLAGYGMREKIFRG